MPEPDENANSPRAESSRGDGRTPGRGKEKPGKSLVPAPAPDAALEFQSRVLAQVGRLTSQDATSILEVSTPQIASDDRKRRWSIALQAIVVGGGVGSFSLAIAITATKFGLDPIVTSTLVATTAGSTTVGVVLRQFHNRGGRGGGGAAA